MKLCWNAIVRNEAARIERAMQSLIGYVDCAVILDTGSTDDTVKIIQDFFGRHGLPVEVHSGDFVNFEQARNDALDLARASALDWDYLLLLDADMELRVPGVLQLTGEHGAYLATQKHGRDLEYGNIRFVRRSSQSRYVGVTHEYMNVPELTGIIPPSEVYFLDHADGANRADKYPRDIKLLKEALEKDPNNVRYHFYLAQSYRDAGMPREAVDWYKKRVALGGWDEEVWNAQLSAASCMCHYDEAGFVLNTLAAYNMRPQRAEALYDLAKFYVEKGMNKPAALFAKEAMNTPKPDDKLFLNPSVYEVGAKEVYSIAAFYDEKTRPEGFRVCDSLAIGTHGYAASTQQARSNLLYYMPRAAQVFSSFWSKRIELRGQANGWALLNPSIARRGKDVLCIVRSVNYTITPEGRYDIDGKGSDIAADNPIRTQNYLVKLDGGLQVSDVRKIIPPSSDKFPLVLGWEDMRLFYSGGALHTSATVREANDQGHCEQWIGRLSDNGDHWSVDDARQMLSRQEHEKNWMPVVNGGVRFVYKLGEVVTPAGAHTPRYCPINNEHMRGSSQVVPFRSGYLGIVHEASCKPDGQRYYFHRFVFFDYELNVQKVSLPFVFHDTQIEFCAGLCVHPDGKHLLISYGVKDNAAWVAKVDGNDVVEFIYDAR